MSNSRSGAFVSGILFIFLVFFLGGIYFFNQDSIQKFYTDFNVSKDVTRFVGEYQNTAMNSIFLQLQDSSVEDSELAERMQASVSDPETYRFIAKQRLDLYKKSLLLVVNAIEVAETIQTDSDESKEIQSLFLDSLEKRREAYDLYISGLEKNSIQVDSEDDFVHANKAFVEAEKLNEQAYEKIKEECVSCKISSE